MYHNKTKVFEQLADKISMKNPMTNKELIQFCRQFSRRSELKSKYLTEQISRYKQEGKKKFGNKYAGTFLDPLKDDMAILLRN